MGIYSGDGRKLGAPAENYAYRLYYTRVVNGVKCLVNEGKSIDDMSDGIPCVLYCGPQRAAALLGISAGNNRYRAYRSGVKAVLRNIEYI